MISILVAALTDIAPSVPIATGFSSTAAAASTGGSSLTAQQMDQLRHLLGGIQVPPRKEPKHSFQHLLPLHCLCSAPSSTFSFWHLTLPDEKKYYYFWINRGHAASTTFKPQTGSYLDPRSCCTLVEQLGDLLGFVPSFAWELKQDSRRDSGGGKDPSILSGSRVPEHSSGIRTIGPSVETIWTRS